MSTHLPNVVDPHGFVDRRIRVVGSIPLASMARLGAMLAVTDGEATAELQFGLSERKRPTVNGEVKAPLQLVCQRCLESMRFDATASVALQLVTTPQQAEEVDAPYEPAMLVDGKLSLWDLVEDELILALPAVAKHPAGQCTAAWRDDSAGAADNTEARPNPFAVLAELKGKKT